MNPMPPARKWSSATSFAALNAAPDTAAARFVTRHGLGRVVPYRRAELAAAVEALCTPGAQARHRAAAAALAPALSARDMEAWLWRSLEAGQPVDDRFATLEQLE